MTGVTVLPVVIARTVGSTRVTGRRFGTLLAHLLPQNATKRHDCALLSHCVYTW